MNGAAPERTPDAPACLHEIFLRSAAAHAAHVAVDVPPSRAAARTTLTYAALERRSRALAAALSAHVQGECVVALLLPRDSAAPFVAELAVLRAGAAYTALDVAFPDAHLRFLLEDSAAVAVVTDDAGRARLLALGCDASHIVHVDAAAFDDAAAPATPWLGPASLAYVVYTSGTTGRPKGVLIEHRSIVNLVLSDVAHFGLGPADRVAQGSSHAYDSSVEETWLAFAVGAAVVVLDDETARSGPDLVPWAARERVSVLCPPPTLLRATGCTDPARALPDLRLLYVGGEALPQDLAELWGRGRRLENGYGPTECTVTVVRAELRPGEPVVIGRAVAGNVAHVLDAELRDVADGTPGELCIAGAGLARGYLGRPELTAERFPVHSAHGRIYRTGDLVRRDARGDLHCLGRIDTQVKVRGHRVELEAVEARLAACAGVRAAACALQGEGAAARLVAYVVPADASAPPDAAALRAQLARELPSAMVPAHVGVLARLPTSVGGKLDRAALPVYEPPRAATSGDAPRDALEAAVCAAFGAVLGMPDAPPGADFFLELGGDSLRAALVIARLRAAPETERLAVRDLYDVRSARGLAERARANGADAVRQRGRPPVDVPARRRRHVRATLARAPALLVELVVASALAYLVVFLALPWLCDALGVTLALVAGPFLLALLALVATPPAVVVAVLTKRVLVGRYRAERTPVWSPRHVRMLVVESAVSALPWKLLAGTELCGVVLRALGARVGRGVHVHRGVDLARGGFDLLEVGDDAVLAQESALHLVALDDGEVVVAPVRIGARAVVDTRAGVAGGAVLGDDAHLTPLSWLDAGAAAGAGERWDGVPARCAGAAERAPADAPPAAFGPWTHALLLVAARQTAGVVARLPLVAALALLAAAAGVDAAVVRAWLASPSLAADVLLVLAAVWAAGVAASLVVEALVARAVAPREEGVVARRSVAAVRAWVATDAVDHAGDWLSGTLFWPLWLRLAGMRVGARCEVSTILDVVPRLVSIGDECFLADGIYLGGPLQRAWGVGLRPTELGARSFFGNHVVVPAGERLPPDVLVGVCTIARAADLRGHDASFGHPAFPLPRPAAEPLDRRLTHEPDALRRVTRIAWETARFALPLPLLALAGLWCVVTAAPQLAPAPLVGASVAFVVCAAAACALVLALKWVLLGRVRPGRHALWSCWCSRWDFLYVAWGMLARGTLARLEGTPFLTWFLRAIGMRIGRGVVLGGGFAQVVDPDMLTFEDGVTVDGLFQAHTFEDRVLKIGPVTLRRDATVATGAVLFYDVDVGARAHVAAHGVVTKGERLLPATTYTGAPVRP